MNFSEFSEAYDKAEKKKSTRKKKSKRGENPGDKNIVGQTHPFNVVGDTGLDGDGYAWAEEIPANNVTEATALSNKERAKREESERAHKEADDRMRYGKKGKAYHDATSLRPGEVKYWDKETKQWVSNKDR